MNLQRVRAIGTESNVDVLIVGGGTAGVIAAIQSARAGAITLLVECGSQLGGTTTTGGVAFPGLFHAHGKQVIKGIGWELVEEAVKMNDDHLPDFTIPYGNNWDHGHSAHHIHLNPYLYTLLAEEKCVQAGVQLRFYETPIDCLFDSGTWVVHLIGKGIHKTIRCKQVVDCTGNALLSQLAGFAVVQSEICQPGSMMFKLVGYEPDGLDIESIQSSYEDALETGRFKKEEYFSHIGKLLYTGHCKNISTTFLNHIHGADSTTSETHTVANVNGRNALLRMLRFLRTQPGLEHTKIQTMCNETGIRETYRIQGVHEITIDEFLSGARYPDAVSNSFYPIDLHDTAGVKPRQLEIGVVPSIPLRAMVPQKSQNFIVAGRCISSDQQANSALRVQASSMGMGQAAGAVAALAAEMQTTPLNIPIERIHILLRQHGAIIPEL